MKYGYLEDFSPPALNRVKVDRRGRGESGLFASLIFLFVPLNFVIIDLYSENLG